MLSVIIIAYKLPEEIASQSVALGTSLEDLKLPAYLKATVRIGKLEEIPMEDTKEVLQDTDSQSEAVEDLLETESADIEDKGDIEVEKDESLADGFQSQMDSETDITESGMLELNPDLQLKDAAAWWKEEVEEMIAVDWLPSPNYDGEKVGTYIFTPQIEGFMGTIPQALFCGL